MLFKVQVSTIFLSVGNDIFFSVAVVKLFRVWYIFNKPLQRKKVVADIFSYSVRTTDCEFVLCVGMYAGANGLAPYAGCYWDCWNRSVDYCSISNCVCTQCQYPVWLLRVLGQCKGGVIHMTWYYSLPYYSHHYTY